MSEPDRATAQTLHRGLDVLELLADAGPLSAAVIADRLGLARPVVHRLLKTFEQRGLLEPGASDGRYGLGLGLLTLARRAVRSAREAALPELGALTARFGATAFLGVREGDEIVCVVSTEPESQIDAIRHREGMRLPLTGASGTAIRAAQPARPSDDAETRAARAAGYAVSRGRLFPGATGVAAALPVDGRTARRSIAVVFARSPTVPVDAIGAAVRAAAERVAAAATMADGVEHARASRSRSDRQ